ncbi:MAG: BglG family transcription antiterminator, partial [Erysipelotrichaceae bacterium]
MNKKARLIQTLLKESPLTASTLSSQLDISVRTAKNYIYQINDEFPGTIVSSHQGYIVDKDLAYDALRQYMDGQSNLPETSKERVVYLLNTLLKSHANESFNVYDLSDELCVSASTIRNELRQVKNRLNKFDIEFISRGDNFKIEGPEKNKRKMLSTILYEESDIRFINLDTLQQSFENINIDLIKNIVLKTFQDYHYFINDYSLSSLVLHLALTIERIRDENYYVLNNCNIRQDIIELKIAKDISSQIQNYFHISFCDAELYEMALLIASRASSFNYEKMNEKDLEQFVGEECVNLVKVLVDDIKALYLIDLSDTEFMIRFTLHIYNLLIRSRNNYLCKNPLTREIKNSYPLIYDMSVSIAKTIIDRTGINMNDDEIAFIAFHIGGIIEAQKNLATKLSVVIFCPKYYDLSLKLSDTLMKYFSNDLIINGVFTREKDLCNLKNINLIITTVPLNIVLNIPIFEVNMFFTSQNRHKLEEIISEINLNRQRKELKDYLIQLITPELFEKLDDAGNKEECLEYMASKLIKLDYVDSSFFEEVLKREQLSSTAFGNFAIPHSMKMKAIKTGINVVITKNPIVWDKYSVNLVLMMCFNKNERYIFNNIYDVLT